MAEARRPEQIATIASIAASWIALGTVDRAFPKGKDPVLVASAVDAAPVAPPPAATSAARAAEPPVDPVAHDRSLWPCEGLRRGAASCVPELLPLARGRLERAREYLRSCRVCTDRSLVEALRRQLEAHVTRLETDRIEQRFQAALARGENVAAVQLLADADIDLVDKRWLARAVKTLRRIDPALSEVAGCRTPPSISVLVSPAAPAPGEPVRVVYAAEEDPGRTEILLDGQPVTPIASGGGPPFYRAGEVELATAGTHSVSLRSGGRILACRAFSVRERTPRADHGTGAWTNRIEWNRASERLYSTWVAHLFDAPENARWQGLHQLTRDRVRNLLFDHLGLGEDGAKALELTPDCADAPYMLRAYFAWKMGLPFGRHECRFGTRTGAPECGAFRTNRDPVEGPNNGRVARFAAFAEQLKEDIHARSLRTDLNDDVSDLYPLELTREALRPGAVFSDPYGHTLTLVRWVPQGPERDGALLAVDAQPDGSLRMKRFWRGTFLFPERHPIQGHGFKAFRPITADGGELRVLGNDELGVAAGYGDVSLEQRGMAASDFYARMGRMINPRPLPPEREYRALHEALHAQLELRVTEVQAAEEILAESPGRVIPMPEGRRIFHAGGAWEALSTPCRDMRLLVGMDVLLAFPEQVGSAQELKKLHEVWGGEMVVRYRKSDGGEQVLSLAELLQRRAMFEMGYNPNDCVERRWGAAEGGEEMKSCGRRAPGEQERKMKGMRKWFERRYACG